MNEEKIFEYLGFMRELLDEIEKEMKEMKMKGNKNEEKKFFTIQEFSNITGLHQTTVWKQIRAGKIPARRIGKKYFIPSDFYQS